MRIRAPSPRWSDWPMILRQPTNWDQRRNGERLLKEHLPTSTTAKTGPEGCETYRVQGHDLHRLLSRLTEYPKESLGPIPLLDTRRRPVSTCAYPWRRLSPERVTYRWRLRGGRKHWKVRIKGVPTRATWARKGTLTAVARKSLQHRKVRPHIRRKSRSGSKRQAACPIHVATRQGLEPLPRKRDQQRPNERVPERVWRLRGPTGECPIGLLNPHRSLEPRGRITRKGASAP